ncbi:MAG: TonB-dependent receptor [Bacteroidetes bacterium]|nr:TonB-dependent receptor [Bacteroidota bacterium]
MKLPLSILLLGCSSFELLNAQMAQDTIKSTVIDPVLITGTRTSRTQSTLPIPTQVITGESIRASGVSRLNEIIQEQTGLVTVPDFGGGEGVQIQGLDAAYVMILLDGQPLFGRSAGTLDLSRISVHNIDKIEVVKGASSCLYGSEALAGVINIITKSPKETNKLLGNISYKLGTFSTHDASINLDYGTAKLRAEFFANYYDTKGYNLSDNAFSQTVEPFSNFSMQPKFKYYFNDKVNLSISSRLFIQNQDYKSEIGNNQYIGKHNIDEWNHSLVVQQSVGEKLKLTYDLYATQYKADEYLNDAQMQLFEKSKYNQFYFRPELRSSYSLGKKTITSGIGINFESLERTDFKEKALLNSEYIFGQLEWFIGQKWNVLAGFRYDHHHQYQSQWSPKLGINYKWNENLSLKSSVGYGYKAPDLRQLYFNFSNSAIGYSVIGYNVATELLDQMDNQGQLVNRQNIDFSQPLKPESSVNFNFGGVYKKNRWSAEANLFYNQIENLIDSKIVAQKNNGQSIFSYFNVHQIFTYGLELNSSYQLSSNLSFSVGYQYLIAKDLAVVEGLKEGKIYARDPETLSSFSLKSKDYFGLYNRSKHTANFKVKFKVPEIKSSAELRVIYRSKYGISDANSNGILDNYDDFVKGYFLSHLTINTELNSQFSLQAGVLNIFNYKDRYNISNLPGRQIFGKISFHF